MAADLNELRHDHHGCRLCVRQRAEAADRIEQLEAAVSAMEVVETYSWWALSEDGGIAMSKSNRHEAPGVREEDLERTVREFCDRFPTYKPVRVVARKTVGPTETVPWTNPWTGKVQP